MQEPVSPRQVAQAIGVSESSVKRWCDQGLIPTVRTAGGHRRLPIEGVIGFLRRSEHELVDPQLLGLPPVVGGSPRKLNVMRTRFIEAILAGQAEVCRQLLLGAYLEGHEIVELCDDLIAPTFHVIGEQWQCGETAVWQERRACEICVRLLHELGRTLPPAQKGAPRAIGGTSEGDQYWLPTTMTELVLREQGWNADSLGVSLPFDSLVGALTANQPRLFWLSVSHIQDPDTFPERFAQLGASAEEMGIALVVGGRALSKALREQMRYSAYCDNFRHLRSFVRTLSPPEAR